MLPPNCYLQFFTGTRDCPDADVFYSMLLSLVYIGNSYCAIELGELITPWTMFNVSSESDSESISTPCSASANRPRS